MIKKLKPIDITPSHLKQIGLGNDNNGYYYIRIYKEITTFLGIHVKTKKYLALGCQEFSKEEVKTALRFDKLSILNLKCKFHPKSFHHSDDIDCILESIIEFL